MRLPCWDDIRTASYMQLLSFAPNERKDVGAACSIVDRNSPPNLECGQDLVVSFAKDPWYGHTTDPENCEGTHRYYRFYSVDYTE
jgi:hypothetical protein